MTVIAYATPDQMRAAKRHLSTVHDVIAESQINGTYPCGVDGVFSSVLSHTGMLVMHRFEHDDTPSGTALPGVTLGLLRDNHPDILRIRIHGPFTPRPVAAEPHDPMFEVVAALRLLIEQASTNPEASYDRLRRAYVPEMRDWVDETWGQIPANLMLTARTGTPFSNPSFHAWLSRRQSSGAPTELAGRNLDEGALPLGTSVIIKDEPDGRLTITFGPVLFRAEGEVNAIERMREIAPSSKPMAILELHA